MAKKKEQFEDFSIEEKIYIWELIEKNVFSPSSLDDKRNWVKQFIIFINKQLQISDTFTELEKNDEIIATKNAINFKFGELSFNFPVNVSKFGFTIYFNNQNKQTFDFDNNYFSQKFENQNINLEILQNKITNSSDFEEIIKQILVTFIVHPTIHNHIDKKRHGIRINFATQNPFLFLYQFCFQLIHDGKDYKENNLKQDEINRLSKIIATKFKIIKEIKQITIGNLFLK